LSCADRESRVDLVVAVRQLAIALAIVECVPAWRIALPDRQSATVLMELPSFGRKTGELCIGDDLSRNQ
jgi:hypothetical protein